MLNLPINKTETNVAIKVCERVCSGSPPDIKNVDFKVKECPCESPPTGKRKLRFFYSFGVDTNAVNAIT